MLPTICLMLKAPRPGTVKTRLAKDIGDEAACGVFRQLVEHQLAQISAEWPVEIHYAPREARPEMEAWLGNRYVYLPQPEGHLGNRLHHAMEGAFARGAQGVILLGGDCPEVTGAVLRETAAKLAEYEVVIGPATDGGYYLMAIRQSQPRLLEDIDWSTEKVFGQTMERVRELGLSSIALAPFSDVDDLSSWNQATAAGFCPIRAN
jgi:rSAM/selenodomain-associated transferase 1